MTIAGAHFDADAADNTVLFGDAAVAVSAASETELTVTVPAMTESQVAVAVKTGAGHSKSVPLKVSIAGEATALEPQVAFTGQTVLIRGAGLAEGAISVQIGGMEPRSMERAADGVRVVVPDLGLPEGSRTTVAVQAGPKARSFELLIGHLPLLLDVEPKSGRVGQKLVLSGRGFDPDRHANPVTFAGHPALVLSAKTTEITAVVPPPPAGDMHPEIAVAVTVAGSTSAERATYQVARGATSGFRPSFFPDAVTEITGDDPAIVATEIGPVLLLAGALGGLAPSARSPPLRRSTPWSTPRPGASPTSSCARALRPWSPWPVPHARCWQQRRRTSPPTRGDGMAAGRAG